MKKSLISSLVATALLLVGSISPVIAQADTTTVGNINTTDKGAVSTKMVSRLYSLNNGNLKLVRNRALAANTPWVYNKSVKGVDGQTYYRVATNEWVGNTNLASINGNGTSTSTPANRTKTTIYIGNWSSAVVDQNGNRSGRVLAAHSAWVAFGDKVTINGKNYYQIGANQYVSTYDIGNAPVANNNNNNNSNNNPGVNVDTSTTGKVIGNSNSHIYHVPGQRGYNINSTHLVYFNNEQDAINAGYRKALV